MRTKAVFSEWPGFFCNLSYPVMRQRIDNALMTMHAMWRYWDEVLINWFGSGWECPDLFFQLLVTFRCSISVKDT